MFDYHSHILPAIDDGARSAEESVRMLSTLKSLGINDLVLSSHFYSNDESAADFLKKRDSALSKLMAVTEGTDIPRLHLGAEVYLTSLLFNNDDLNALTVNGGGCMLTELPYDKKLSTTVLSQLEALVYNKGITPVLAHIDRYPFLLDADVLDELFAMGCRAQVNIEAFCGKKKRLLKRLVKKGFVFALGTDAHRHERLETAVAASLSAISDVYGSDFVNYMGQYTKENLL